MSTYKQCIIEKLMKQLAVYNMKSRSATSAGLVAFAAGNLDAAKSAFADASKAENAAKKLPLYINFLEENMNESEPANDTFETMIQNTPEEQIFTEHLPSSDTTQVADALSS